MYNPVFKRLELVKQKFIIYLYLLIETSNVNLTS